MLPDGCLFLLARDTHTIDSNGDVLIALLLQMIHIRGSIDFVVSGPVVIPVIRNQGDR